MHVQGTPCLGVRMLRSGSRHLKGRGMRLAAMLLAGAAFAGPMLPGAALAQAESREGLYLQNQIL